MEGTAGGGTLVPEHGPFRDSCLLLHHQDPRVHGTGALYHWGGLLFGAMLPFGVFNHIIRQRQDLIVRQLPDVLDLLSISVQAGLSFDGALKKVVERMEGPLIDEFRWMLRDIRMGMTRARSMKFMAERCDIQDIYLFVMSVTQSEKLGASMSDTLKIQADNMRNIRRQRARTLAMKAPVKWYSLSFSAFFPPYSSSYCCHPCYR